MKRNFKELSGLWPKLTNGRENPIQKRKSSFENKDSIQYFNKNIKLISCRIFHPWHKF